MNRSPHLVRHSESLAVYRPLGNTVLELTIAGAILAVLCVLAIKLYQDSAEEARVSEAISDIRGIETALARYQAINYELPESLADAGQNIIDPWGNPYQYVNLAGADRDEMRKSRSFGPINSDYDLYSTGADGQSLAPLTAKRSRDDIVRANNGAFLGVAEAY